MKKYLHTMIVVGAVVLASSNVMATEISAEQEVTIVEVEETEEIEEVEEVSKGQQVVDYALQFIGTPYVSGGNNLNSGVDCSGFTQQVYKHFGINLERSSRSQYSTNGVSVTKDELKPGDLVFYGYGSVNHVAIYIGNGQIVHSPTPGQTVCTAPLWQRGDANLIGYKRIFN